ncbi:MAG: hypothetical protein LC105_06005 [Chitinophagales bacterium]|nr:hypothetical protein [Chitinophagales bacterium]
MKKVSNTTQVRNNIAKQTALAKREMGLDVVAYNNLQFETGMQLLEEHLVFQRDILEVSSSKLYWNWFKIQWLQYEYTALKMIPKTTPKKEAQESFIDKMSGIVYYRRLWLALKQFLELFSKDIQKVRDTNVPVPTTPPDTDSETNLLVTT